MTPTAKTSASSEFQRRVMKSAALDEGAGRGLERLLAELSSQPIGGASRWLEQSAPAHRSAFAAGANEALPTATLRGGWVKWSAAVGVAAAAWWSGEALLSAPRSQSAQPRAQGPTMPSVLKSVGPSNPLAIASSSAAPASALGDSLPLGREAAPQRSALRAERPGTSKAAASGRAAGHERGVDSLGGPALNGVETAPLGVVRRASDDVGAAEPATKAGSRIDGRVAAQEAAATPTSEALAKRSDLGREVAELARVRGLLAGGAASAALAQLQVFMTLFPRARLSQEAAVLRIHALQQAGQLPAAKAAAQTFLREFPRSPHRSEIRRWLSEVGRTVAVNP